MNLETSALAAPASNYVLEEHIPVKEHIRVGGTEAAALLYLE